MLSGAELIVLEEKLALLARPTGVAAYDFDFRLHFACRHPYRLDTEVDAILRIGAPEDYAAYHAEAVAIGLRPINDPARHLLASEIERWSPLIAELTPKTRVFDVLPDADLIESEFGWPVFLKGSRQTSKHNPGLAVIRDREHYRRACDAYRKDPILHWQKPALREFVPLTPVPGVVAGKIRPSLEFRTFWLHGRCVGFGPYWYQVSPYRSADIDDGLTLAADVAARVPVPFLVVDIAKTTDGRWIAIECNDAQESGHAGIAPQRLWRSVLDVHPHS
jgi:ATP-grasp domain, R2K clade family 3